MGKGSAKYESGCTAQKQGVWAAFDAKGPRTSMLKKRPGRGAWHSTSCTGWVRFTGPRVHLQRAKNAEGQQGP
jgi:hypothetical protein